MTNEKEKYFRTAGGLISNVLNAFQGMLDGLDWMDNDSKKGAYDKVLNIQKNIAYPDFLTDNKKLDDYYQNLDITATDSYYLMLDKLNKLDGISKNISRSCLDSIYGFNIIS